MTIVNTWGYCPRAQDRMVLNIYLLKVKKKYFQNS